MKLTTSELNDNQNQDVIEIEEMQVSNMLGNPVT